MDREATCIAINIYLHSNGIKLPGKRVARLELAKQLGADYTIQVTGKEDPKELADKVEEILGDQPDITIDCVGTTECVQLAVHVSWLTTRKWIPCNVI